MGKIISYGDTAAAILERLTQQKAPVHCGFCGEVAPRHSASCLGVRKQVKK